MSKTATNGGTGGIGRAGFWGIVGALAVLTLAALLLIWSGLHRAEANRVRIEATARLFAAVQSDSVSDAKTALAAGADPNGREAVDRTPLRFSLLKARAALGSHDAERALSYQGNTLLSRAVMVEGNPAMVSLLLNAGAAPDGRVHYGDTPLRLAVSRARRGPDGDRYRAIIRLLLAAGADPNALDGHGNTLLIVALTCGADKTAVRTLLDAGADPDRKNARGVSARAFLTAASDPAVAALLRP